MSVPFALAGMSTVYALKNRTTKQYINERFFKLFIPLISAILLLIPVQTYIADKYFNHYTGSDELKNIGAEQAWLKILITNTVD